MTKPISEEYCKPKVNCEYAKQLESLFKDFSDSAHDAIKYLERNMQDDFVFSTHEMADIQMKFNKLIGK